MAHNVCVSRLRSKSRRRLFERPHDFQEVEDQRAAPEIADEELFGLEDALAGMPEQRRAILLSASGKAIKGSSTSPDLTCEPSPPVPTWRLV